MEYVTSEELSKLCGICPRQIRKLCAKGSIEGIIKEGTAWKIPEEANRLKDNRIKSGKYSDWRKKYGRRKSHIQRIIMALYLFRGRYAAARDEELDVAAHRMIVNDLLEYGITSVYHLLNIWIFIQNKIEFMFF